MPKVMLATGNLGKLREMQALLRDVDITLYSPTEIGLVLDVVEHGQTYAQNAALKAIAFAQACGFTALADDSGLEVDALDGLPGIHSARFAPQPGATDADRRQYLLEKLAGYPRPWGAQFCCTVALATPAGDVRFAEGACQGEIIPDERGQLGFGYDPIFLIPALGRTMAELTMDEKNQLSHRARAVRAAIPILEDMLLEMRGL